MSLLATARSLPALQVRVRGLTATLLDQPLSVGDAGFEYMGRVLHGPRRVLCQAAQVAGDAPGGDEVHVAPLPHEALADQAVHEVVPHLVARDLVAAIFLHAADELLLLPA